MFAKYNRDQDSSSSHTTIFCSCIKHNRWFSFVEKLKIFIEKLLHQNVYRYESTDSNSATDSEESTISGVKIGIKTVCQGRMPTRRPNPNVQNRNALLARENRRKKKAHLEAMEKELEEVRAANKQLKKALKQQMKTVGQLQREKRYFQSVIANHKEIENLIKALNVRMHVQQSPTVNSPILSSPAHSYGSQQLQQSSSILRQTNSVDNIEWNVASTSENSDNDFMPSSAFNNTWPDILHEDLGTKGLKKLTTVGGEHSYADVDQVPSLENIEFDAGICLHIRKLVYKYYLFFNEM
ncbi:CREB/ATF bZIP transcription factor isoform X2 [Bactrocera oleae]|uniref:CREB/ATF bZIP transcription factor isoform X2 n=1 Tax=Bactrocera oleae TaxID=104688 RepID=UPI00387E4FA6